MVHGTEQGMVQSPLRTRNWMAAGIVGLMLLMAMIFILPVNVSADDSVSIGNRKCETISDVQTKLSDIATVNIESNTINITMNKNVIGRISLAIPNVHINFDANGKTLNGQGQVEPLCFDHTSNATATIFGNGTFLGGSNYALYAGVGQTVTIKNGTFTKGGRKIFAGEGTIRDQRHTHSYKIKAESSKYLKKEADNCQKNNIYWYACSTCGASAGDDAAINQTETAYYTGKSVGPHNVTETWQHGTKDGQQTHYKKCTVEGCDYRADEAICSGGTATCQEKAKCATCGAEYGALADHNYVWVITDDIHWMECQTEGCKDIQKKGGHFDLDKDGKCDYCSYKMKLAPTPATPADPQKPETAKITATTQQTDKTPKTGDDNFAAPLLAALFLSGSLGAVCIANRKRENM